MLSLHRSLSWSTSLPSVSPRIVLASIAHLEYLPPISQSVRAPLYHPRNGRSVGLPPSSFRAPLCRPRIGRSVGVPPSRQSVCQGASVSSSHRSLSWSTFLVCQGPSVSSSRWSLSWSTSLICQGASVLASSSHRSFSWSTSLTSVSLSV